MILQFIFHFYYTVAFFNFKQYIVLKKLFNIFFLNFIEKDLLSLYALVNIRTILHSNQQGCFRFPINYFLVVDPVYNYNTYGFCSQLYQSGQKKHQSRVFSLIRGPHVHNKSHKQFIFQWRKQYFNLFCFGRPVLLNTFFNKLYYYYYYYRVFSAVNFNLKFLTKVNYTFKCIFLV